MAQLDVSIQNLIHRKKELENYDYIIHQVMQTDVSSDVDFQRKFKYIYKIRRNAEWRNAYYDFFEENKNNSVINFEFILRNLFDLTGRIEASFASKMLAAIKPEMPIWDSIVLSKLQIKPSQNPDKQKRLNETVEIYSWIHSLYSSFIQTSEASKFIQAFDEAFPEYTGFSIVKKIDFIIWGSGDSNPLERELMSNNITALKTSSRKKKRIKSKEKIPSDRLPDAAGYALIEANKWSDVVSFLNQSNGHFDEQICVLAMLATELYLKAVFMKKGIQEIGHDISNLYEKLNANEKRMLKKGIKPNRFVFSSLTEHYLHFETFEEELDYVSKDFVDLRYNYETFNSGYPVFILTEFILPLMENSRKLAKKIVLGKE